jgi:preprotein translocase subunit YajC
MNALAILAAEQQNGGFLLTVLLYIIIFVPIVYFGMIRPQKKQRMRQMMIMDSMAVGDSVLTTAGFYGVVIDVSEEVVIVEFGNNKNCRIPMKKEAIVEVEKANTEE